MKRILSAIALAALFSTSAFAAQQITNEEKANYTKIGDLSYSQEGETTVGNEEYSAKADAKCQELGNIPADNCYYLIISKVGDDTNFKNINLELFKKS